MAVRHLLLNDDLLQEELVQFLICKIDAQLLERIHRHVLEPKNIQNANVRVGLGGLGPQALVDHRNDAVEELHVDGPGHRVPLRLCLRPCQRPRAIHHLRLCEQGKQHFMGLPTISPLKLQKISCRAQCLLGLGASQSAPVARLRELNVTKPQHSHSGTEDILLLLRGHAQRGKSPPQLSQEVCVSLVQLAIMLNWGAQVVEELARLHP
mmetsp:Transcript_54350/g.119206  ORF Transcript_54350/g.119206 Transcript_54350/m.119206 type:complete len:209 (-) Transcript_54350:818-1444(-)